MARNFIGVVTGLALWLAMSGWIVVDRMLFDARNRGLGWASQELRAPALAALPPAERVAHYERLFSISLQDNLSAYLFTMRLHHIGAEDARVVWLLVWDDVLAARTGVAGYPTFDVLNRFDASGIVSD